MEIFDLSSVSAFMRSHTTVGWEGLALSLCSNSSQRCSVGLRSELCAGQSSSSTPNSLSMSLWTLLCALVHSQTAPTKLGAWDCPKCLGMLKHSEFPSQELRNVIRHSRERVSTALESSGGMLYTTASNALHCTC